jgi:hypothetical protein
LFNKYLRNYCSGNRTTDENLLYLRQILQKATSTAVPTKTLKLKGPKWKASPTVLQLLKICKAKYQIWVENGKQNDKIVSKIFVLIVSSHNVLSIASQIGCLIQVWLDFLTICFPFQLMFNEADTGT